MSLTTHEQRDVAQQPDRMPAPASASEGIMAQILRVASDPSIDLDRMDKLMAMHERLQKDQAARAFAEALANLQADLPLVTQGGWDDHKKISYSRLEDVLRAVRPAMQQHGFSIGFDMDQEANQVIVTGILTHSQGHERRTTMRFPHDTGPGRNAVQAIGSSETYGRRYVTMALLNIASERDDDGRAAMQSKSEQPKVSQKQVDQLRDLLQATDRDERKFLTFVRFQNLEAIPAAKFDEMVKTINDAKRRGQ